MSRGVGDCKAAEDDVDDLMNVEVPAAAFFVVVRLALAVRLALLLGRLGTEVVHEEMTLPHGVVVLGVERTLLLEKLVELLLPLLGCLSMLNTIESGDGVVGRPLLRVAVVAVEGVTLVVMLQPPVRVAGVLSVADLLLIVSVHPFVQHSAEFVHSSWTVPSQQPVVRLINQAILECVDDVRVRDGFAGSLRVPETLVVLAQGFVWLLLDGGQLVFAPRFLARTQEVCDERPLQSVPAVNGIRGPGFVAM